MNRKQLILLVLALIILGGAGLVLHNRSQQSWDTSGTRLGEKLLPNFQVNDVAAIHIKNGDDLDLVKTNDRWCVKQRDDYPASFAQISDLLIKMGDLKIAQDEPIGPSQLERMHLTDPGKSPDAATLIEFQDSQGKILQSLLLGKKHTRKSDRPTPWGDSEMPDGRYVMLKSDPNNVITVSDPLTSVDAKPSGWLDRAFFKVEKPKSISFVSTNATNSWTLAREGESSPWVLSDVKTNEILDTNKVSSLAGTLSYPSFDDVVADPAPSKTGLDKAQVVTIKTFDGFVYTLNIGDKTENNYNVHVDVEGEFPTNRVHEKDEKPEGTKALDKVFADNLKVRQAKLDQEKVVNKWTYLVSNWMIDPLIRTRAQLMFDKNAKKDGTETGMSIPMPATDSDSSSPPPPSDSGNQ
jgi:hypothetical protein